MTTTNSFSVKTRPVNVNARLVPLLPLMVNHALLVMVHASSVMVLVPRSALVVLLVPVSTMESVLAMLEHSMLPLNHSTVRNAMPHVLPARVQLMVIV